MAEGNIKQLNFEILLNDEKFKKSVQADLKTAKSLNKQLSELLNLKQQLNAGTTKQLVNTEKVRQAELATAEAAEKVAQAKEKTKQAQEKTRQAVADARAAEEALASATKKNADEVKRGADNQSRHTSAIKGSQAAMGNLSSATMQLSQLLGVTFGIAGVRRFLSSMIEITGQFEMQQVALRTILQDTEAADKLFSQLYDFSTESTYRFSELAQHAKQLAAFGTKAEDLLETTKMIGDVASGLGVPIDRIILAFGHVQTAGFLRGQQLRSLVQNGVPILEQLSQILSEVNGKMVSVGEVYDRMAKREISFDMVEEAFKRMTSEGGKFYKMQESLSKTLAGQINILKGKWENALYAIGNEQSSLLKGGVKILTWFVDHLREIGTVLGPVIAGFGAYAAALALVAIQSAAVTGVTVAKTLVQVATGATSAAAATEALGMSMAKMRAVALGVVGVIAMVAYEVISSFGKVDKEVQAFKDSLDELYSSIESKHLGSIQREIDKVTELQKVVEDSSMAYDDRKRALESLNSIVPDYNGALDVEGNLYRSNTAAITNYVNGLHALAKAKADEEYLTELYKKKRELEEKQRQNLAKNQQAYAESQDDYWIGNQWRSFVNDWANIFGTYANNYAGTLDETYTTWQIISGELGEINAAISQLEAEGVKAIEAQEKFIESISQEGWRKAVADVLKKYEDVNGLKSLKDTTNPTDWVDAVLKEEKEAADELAKTPDRATKALVQRRIDAINELKKAVPEVDWRNLSSSGHYKSPKAKKSSNALSPEEKAYKDSVEANVNLVKGLISEYKKLEGEGMSKEAIFTMLEMLYPDLPKELKYKDLLDYYDHLAQVVDLMEKSSLFTKKEATALRTYLAGQKIDDVDKATKALDKHEKTVRKWRGEDFNLGGTGFEFDIRKILSDYNSKSAAIDEKLRSATEEAKSAHRGNAQAIKEETDALNALADKERDYERALAQERLNKLASTKFKELTEGLDMRDWGDKTLGQVKKIYTQLLALRKAGVALPKDVQEALESLGFTMDDFNAKLNELFDNAIDNTLEEKVKKVVSAMKEMVGVFGDLGSSLSSLGEAMGRNGLTGAGNVMSFLEEIANYAAENESLMNLLFKGEDVDDAAEGMEDVAESASEIADGMTEAAEATEEMGEAADKVADSSDWITMAVKAALLVVKEICNAMSEEAELQKAVNEQRREGLRLLNETNLAEGTGSIFGQDNLRSLQNAFKERDRLLKKLEETNRIERDVNGIKWTEPVDSSYRFQYAKGFLGIGRGRFTLEDAARKFGMDVYDENGALNVNLLKSILSTYDKLDGEQREWLENAIEYTEEYNAALEQIRQTFDDIYGDILDSAADLVIDRWREMGDAAADYSEILDDVASSYAKMVLKNALMESFFTDEKKDEITRLIQGGDYSGAMRTLEGIFHSLEDAAPQLADAFAEVAPWMKTSDSESSLGKGIQSITEDTASLLASYINAMRADVSVMRGLQEAGWRDVRGLFESTPTLNDYLAQCAANTYDISVSNAAILNTMRSVIGASSHGGEAVKVEINV